MLDSPHSCLASAANGLLLGLVSLSFSLLANDDPEPYNGKYRHTDRDRQGRYEVGADHRDADHPKADVPSYRGRNISALRIGTRDDRFCSLCLVCVHLTAPMCAY